MESSSPTALPLYFGGDAVNWSFGSICRSRDTLPLSPAVLGRCSVHHPPASVSCSCPGAAKWWVETTVMWRQDNPMARYDHQAGAYCAQLSPRPSTLDMEPTALRAEISILCVVPPNTPSVTSQRTSYHPSSHAEGLIPVELPLPSLNLRTAYLADARSNVVRSRLSWCLAACAQSHHRPTKPSHLSQRSSVVVQNSHTWMDTRATSQARPVQPSHALPPPRSTA